MSNTIQRVDYFYTTAKDQPGEAYRLLAQLADLGINLLAFNAVPVGPNSTQLTLFPEESWLLTDAADKTGLRLDGPHHAILIQGDDKLGALAEVHQVLYKANVNVYASNAVSNGKGGYGYLIFVRPEDYEKAATALHI